MGILTLFVPVSANGVVEDSPPPKTPISRAANAASIPTEAAVPKPGNVDAAPDANSNPAPDQSPLIARWAAKAPPANRPANGIFFNKDLPRAFPPIFAASLPANFNPAFSATLTPSFSIILPAP